MKKIAVACLVSCMFWGCSDDDNKKDEVNNTLDIACEQLSSCDSTVDIDQCREKYKWEESYNVCKDVVVAYYTCKQEKGCGYWTNYNNKMSECNNDAACIADVMKNNNCSKELESANKCLNENNIEFVLD